MEILEDRPGLLVFRASGPTVESDFQHEPGGHRWQRVPPTEKRGRMQTSTVTVAVLREPKDTEFRINPAELDWKTTKGSGPGGQNRNKVESAVVLTHLPTGTVVRAETERSQHRNRELALSVMKARLLERQRQAVSNSTNSNRKAQVGSGMRGDKVRTIRTQDGVVTDHRTERKARLDRYLKGFLEDLVG